MILNIPIYEIYNKISLYQLFCKNMFKFKWLSMNYNIVYYTYNKDNVINNVSLRLPSHPYHMVGQSPWPFSLSWTMLSLVISAVLYFHGYPLGDYLLFFAFILLIWGMSLWFKDIITEASYQGYHTDKVQKGLSLGVILFIISEVFFFLSSAGLQALLCWERLYGCLLVEIRSKINFLTSTVLSTAYHIANNVWYGVAGRLNIWKIWLPEFDSCRRIIIYDEDNELGTHRLFQKAPFILSRILRWMFGKLSEYLDVPEGHAEVFMNANINILSYTSNLKTEGHIDEDIKNVQASKDRQNHRVRKIQKGNKTQNKHNKEQIDITAKSFDGAKGMDKPSTSQRMRVRSHHSRIGSNDPSPDDSKGGSRKKPTKDNEISKINKITESILRKVVESKLGNYLNNESKYGNGLIRIIANTEFLLACYILIKGNSGNMTKGIDNTTLDGINIDWFKNAAKKMLDGSYMFNAVRLVEIPKKKGRTRKLGVGSPREKIVQKAIQILLNAIYEPLFLDCSHGFRPNKSTHSALNKLYLHGDNYAWVINGDISNCFDSIPHDLILDNLRKKIVCVRTLTLIQRCINAGVLDKGNKEIIKRNVGVPQGSVISPILANIVLHELDKHIEEIIKGKFEKGNQRGRNKEYQELTNYLRGNFDKIEERKKALKKSRLLSSRDNNDPNFRRLLYVRYADDFVVLITGNKKDTQNIRSQIDEYLKVYCGLTLNLEKSTINILSKGFMFLGAYCKKLIRSFYFVKTKRGDRHFRRRVTPKLYITAPIKELINKLIKTGFARRNDKSLLLAKGKQEMAFMDHSDILRYYNYVINGILTYYSFAGNRSSLHRIFWILRQSCALTLCRKYKLRSMKACFKKFGFDIKDTLTDMRIKIPKSLPVLHKYNNSSVGFDHKTLELNLAKSWAGKLTQSNYFKSCALCGTSSEIEMHHVRSVGKVRAKIQSSKLSTSEWKGAYQRKQIPLCRYHHELYHQGSLTYADLNHISKYTN